MAEPTTFYDWECVVTNVDKKARTSGRIVPMKILQLGLSRTGTESTANALRMLGVYEFYHGWHTIFNNPRDNEMWLEALEAKYEGKGKPYGRHEFDKLLYNCQGVSDVPAILFSEELIKAYPEAKVILTHRDFDTWYSSAFDTIQTRINHPLSKSLIPITYFLRLHSRFTRPTWIKAWDILFQGDFERNARKVYDEHYAKIRSLVPKDRLLDYNVKQGWDPLVEFLGVEHPNIPFPKGNEKIVFVKRFQKALLLTLRAIFVRLFILIVLPVFVAYVLARLVGSDSVASHGIFRSLSQ